MTELGGVGAEQGLHSACRGRGRQHASRPSTTPPPARSPTREELLGWSPTHPTLLDDLEHGDYLATPAY
ncbi:hypothetical protein [Streptomyces flaveolus]|uniref:hypothetical protein n=1 Tax=Streptomyces flaveolus TaxID=67297 RepID=UPI0036A6D8F3